MEKIKLIKSTFLDENKTKEKLIGFLRNSEILSMNKECKKFEENFSNKQGRKYSVFVSNGSCANLLLIQAMLNLGRFKKGDKIAVSSLTWATNVMPLIELGLNPIPVDCEKETLNINVEKIKEIAEKESIKGVFLTNVLGFCSEIDKIQEYCQQKDIIFLEDNCESLGSEYKERLLGNFGFASTFSFFVGHHISTIEGGMICTDDYELYEHLKMIRAHGWTRNNSEDFQKKLGEKNNIDEFYSKYAFYDLAYNFRPTEINGFIGNEQIKHWEFIVNKREENFYKFYKATEKNDKIIKLNLKNLTKVSNFAFPLVFKDRESFLKYQEKFIKNNIEIRPIIAGNITKQPFFRKYLGEFYCENSDFVHQNGFYIPNNPELDESEIKLITSLLKE